VDSKAEYTANLAHVAETKTNKASAPLNQYRLRCMKAVRKE